MAYTAPTPADLKAAFVAFAAVPDASVQFWLDRAARMVDESWTEDDFAFGRMTLAAHYMASNGLGTGTGAGLAAAGLSNVTSMRSGALSLTFKEGASIAGGYSSTPYGLQFATLLRANKGGPGVTPSGTVSCGGCW